MFTALMSMGLVALVGAAAFEFSAKMDEMLSHDAPSPSRPRQA